MWLSEKRWSQSASFEMRLSRMNKTRHDASGQQVPPPQPKREGSTPCYLLFLRGWDLNLVIFDYGATSVARGVSAGKTPRCGVFPSGGAQVRVLKCGYATRTKRDTTRVGRNRNKQQIRHPLPRIDRSGGFCIVQGFNRSRKKFTKKYCFMTKNEV